jgi:hypothetical protein
MFGMMLGILDGHKFVFNKEKFDLAQKKRKDFVEFCAYRWHNLEPTAIKAGIVTTDLLEKIDTIYCEEVEEVDGVNVGLLIGTLHPKWTDAMKRYNKRVRKALVDFAGGDDDEYLDDKLNWALSTEDRARPILPFPTRTALEDVAAALRATPEAIKEVSKCNCASITRSPRGRIMVTIRSRA